MKTPPLLAAALLAGMAAGAAAPTLAAQQDVAPAGALHLGALLAELKARSPRLRAAEAAAAAVDARVADAATLPDPSLQLGVMNVGLPDLKADMASSMAPSVQLTQRVPFPGKLSLAGRIAASERTMAAAAAQEAWWELRDRAAGLFYDLYALDGQVAVMERTLGLLEDFRVVARSRYEAGTGPQADVLRADVEVARMDADIRRMRAVRTATAARLNGLLDRPGATPVPPPLLDPLPSAVPGADTLVAWAERDRPLLLRGRLGVERAGAREALARKAIWPDLTVGVQYGQRDAGMGLERMGSAVVGFSLPVHAGTRQLADRREAAAMTDEAEAELGGLRAVVAARVSELLADLERARSLRDLYRSEVVPEARAMVASAMASYRAGEVDFPALVDAQTGLDRYEGELYRLEADYGAAVAGLESTVGRTLPPTAPLAEDP